MPETAPKSAILEGQYRFPGLLTSDGGVPLLAPHAAHLSAKLDALVDSIASEFQIPAHRLMGYESPEALAESRCPKCDPQHVLASNASGALVPDLYIPPRGR